MFIISYKTNMNNKINNHIMLLLLCFFFLAASSLSMLPLKHIAELATTFSLEAFILKIFGALPQDYLYCLSVLNRLYLMILFTIILATISKNSENYKYIFMGLFTGSFFASVMGLLEYSGIVSLLVVKRSYIASPDIVSSFFLNRGWFAEYVTIILPFSLLGFFSKKKTPIITVVLSVFVVIFGVSIILAKARAGLVTYPLVLFICWLFFYSFKLKPHHEKLKTGTIVKVVFSVPIAIILSMLIISYVIKHANIHQDAFHSTIIQQASRIINPASRNFIWNQGLAIGKEKPILGMGFETFAVYNEILPRIPTSKFIKYNEDTPHNMYIELFVNNGIIGLLLWILIISYTLIILSADLIKNKNMLNIPVIISILCFHVYNVFQDFAYIPIISIIIFLNISYTMTIENTVLTKSHQKAWDFILKTCVIIVILSSIHYLKNSSFKYLQDKYNYTIDKPQDSKYTYKGFYDDPVDRFRWISKEGSIDIAGQGDVEFTFLCEHPDVKQDPVILSVSVNDIPVDKIIFLSIVEKKWKYRLHNVDKHFFKFSVSRVWNPFIFGTNTHNRILGIALTVNQIDSLESKQQVPVHN
ncbi:MAG: O-antigen ligase family protein [Nitrospirae bacterium]|nr:O-antigen ligase family protein [Nitrospirota bacterium]